jgi:hypothetical protein
MSVFFIGLTTLMPIPVNEYKTSMEGKSQAIEHPTADRINSSNPVNNSDLELNLTLRAPKRSEAITPTTEDRVRICPDIPTCCPNVRPISIRSNPVMSPGGCVAKLEIMKDATINPRDERSSLSLMAFPSNTVLIHTGGCVSPLRTHADQSRVYSS